MFHDTQIFIVCFAVDNERALETVDRWFSLENHIREARHAVVLTKCDRLTPTELIRTNWFLNQSSIITESLSRDTIDYIRVMLFKLRPKPAFDVEELKRKAADWEQWAYDPPPVPFFETSAKENVNIDLVFQQLAKERLECYSDEYLQRFERTK